MTSFSRFSLMRSATISRIFIVALLYAAPCGAREISLGISHPKKYQAAAVLSAPRPEIPSQLRDECLDCQCLVEFSVASDGKATVKLLKSSGSKELDEAALSVLKQWKFRPAMLDGEPVASTKKVKIEFAID